MLIPNKPINLFLLLSLLALTLNSCKDEKVISKKAPPPLKVKTIIVEDKNYPIWLQYTGTTKAFSKQEVKARVSGRLQKIFFKDGDLVKKGQKLFLIEQSQYISNLNSAKSKKKRDEASLQLAISDVKRYEPLVKDGLAPRATLEQYQSKRDQLIAQIEADKAAIENAKLELSYTTVIAPVSGKISARYVDKGNLVGYGESTLLSTIVSTDNIYAYFRPSEKDLQIILKYRSQKDMKAFIDIRCSGKDIDKRKRLYGVVDFNDNTVDPLTSTVTMRATIENPNHSVLPGTFVYVNIFLTDKNKFVLVPPQIINEDQLGKYVYVVDKNNTAHRRGVDVGYTNRFYSVIKDGLKDKEQVVISGFMKVRDGSKLDPVDVSKTDGMDAIIEKNKLIPTKSK